MKNRLTIVGLGGSLTKQSSSLAALRIALDGAAETGAQTELFDIRQLALPMFDPGISDPPESVLNLCEATYNADGLIWSSPMRILAPSVDRSKMRSIGCTPVKSSGRHIYDKVVGLISAGRCARGCRRVNTAMEFVVRSLRGGPSHWYCRLRRRGKLSTTRVMLATQTCGSNCGR
jgi:FMN reductase